MAHVSRKVMREAWDLQLDGDEARAVAQGLALLLKQPVGPGYSAAQRVYETMMSVSREES